MSMRDFMLKLHCEQDLNYLLNKEVRARDDIVGPLEPGVRGGNPPTLDFGRSVNLISIRWRVKLGPSKKYSPPLPLDFQTFLHPCIVEKGAATGSLSLNCIQPCLIKLS